MAEALSSSPPSTRQWSTQFKGSLDYEIASSIMTFHQFLQSSNTKHIDFYTTINSTATSDAINSILVVTNSTGSQYLGMNKKTINSTGNQHIEIAADIYDELFTWHGICIIFVFCAFIVFTIIGNTLVILAVITTRRLRTVTNCFVMSLAVADLLVGIFVMPPAAAVHLVGSWQLGWILCDIWISLDVLLCTASILSLCAISVDRYLAVTQPLTYSRKRRSKRLALTMILVVWFLALAITCPPILGWYEPGRRDLMECRYNQNGGYVIFSAMGSFFIPMSVMIYVYARISCVVATRHDNMTDIGIHKMRCTRYQSTEVEAEIEPDMSEQENLSPGHKRIAAKTLSNQTIGKDFQEMVLDDIGNPNHSRNGSFELISSSRTPSFKRQPSIGAKTPSTSTTEHWSFANRHSIRHHHGTCGNEMYSTKTTRVHQKSLSSRIISLKKESKTTQTLTIVVGGFIACWLPFFIYYIITPFLSEESVSRPLATCLTWLGWFNSAINPFIYAFYSVEFRAAFWRLTFKRFFKNPSKGNCPNNIVSIRR